MKSWLLILGAAITLLNFAAPIAAERRVVCYYGSWAAYRPGDGKFEVENIDPNLCTHAIYAFVGLESNGGVRILDSWNEIDKGGFRRFNDLKKINPEFKTLVAIGGWNEGSTSYSSLVNDVTRRTNLVTNIVNFVQQYGFDGFDVDWEYPGQRGGAASDKDAFSQLLRELREKFDESGLLLSAAVASVEASASLSYNVPDLGRYLDFINIMTYDLHGSWDPVTGHSAPLYPGPDDDGFTVHEAIQYWINAGAPREKINLGIGTYGRTYTLSSGAPCALGAPATGAGLAGPYTSEAGSLGYNEICEEQSRWDERWDDQQKVSYACSGDQFAGYDNVESTRLKAKYAVEERLGGVMIWSVETDDFLGKCQGIKYPLLTAINEALTGGVVPETTTASTAASTTPTTTRTTATSPTTTTRVPETTTASTAASTTPTTTRTTATSPTTTTRVPETTTASTAASTTPTTTRTTATSPTTTTRPTDATTDGGASDLTNLCTQEGFVRDPSNRRVFYQCHRVFDSFVAYRFECAADLVFDTSINVCNWAYAVSN